MAYQTYDILEAMEAETGARAPSLAVDGGAIANDFLAQFQADIIDRPVVRPPSVESTALGAAYLAGLKAGVWKNAQELTSLKEIDRTFTPTMNDATRRPLLEGWRKALRQAIAK